MRVTSMQPIDYLKVHLAYDGIKTGIYRAFKRITRKTLALAEESVVVIVAMAIIIYIFSYSTLIESVNDSKVNYDSTKIELKSLYKDVNGIKKEIKIINDEQKKTE